MAGIVGIISNNPESGKKDLNHSFASMMQNLSFSDAQLRKSFVSKNICFGNIVPVSCRRNDHFQHNNELDVYAVIDGLVFVPAMNVQYFPKDIIPMKSNQITASYLFCMIIIKKILPYMLPDRLIFSFMMINEKYLY